MNDERHETFRALRRVDGEPIFGEYSWYSADGSDPWQGAREDAPDAVEDPDADPVEYELVEMTVRVLERQTFGGPAPASSTETRPR